LTEVCLLTSKQPNKIPKQSNIVAAPFPTFFTYTEFCFPKMSYSAANHQTSKPGGAHPGFVS
jgi:hypothetical protein